MIVILYDHARSTFMVANYDLNTVTSFEKLLKSFLFQH